MKKIILVLFFSTFIITSVNSQVPENIKINVSCRGTGDYGAKSFNWFDDYTFFFIPEFDAKGKVTSYYMGALSLDNCSHCMGRNGNYFGSVNAKNFPITITSDSIKFREFGDPKVNTTISRSSGNFSSIDSIQNGQTVVSRVGSCTNINLLYSKIDELKNLKVSKSSNSPNKGTDSAIKDTLKKIIGK
jgi:hypothetical protein